MITASVVQSCIDSLKSIAKVDFCVYDTKMIKVAATFEPGDSFAGTISGFIDSPADSQVISGCHLIKIYDEDEPETPEEDPETPSDASEEEVTDGE